ncbi:DeoR/GlpR family DNA-binding transcription regulator [Methylobrevis pamukkalensis]|uniref:HTH-type transcriptional repressor GlcR n=1 Tax=Methylobrevis pamukkalensis TaxID=1439726 RepID=A0A1E3H342_9HYPH|nr:DeoR/GlpR family DNA-binding transcription regulator [Methylobrevis pamukkalensis]ODN69961.1 HTH-type transcriptional repressor GlcR [Methylobrevis pamukkalensis]
MNDADPSTPKSGGDEPAGGVLPLTRQQRLVELLAERGQVTVAELVTLFEVSRDTIRRDLDLLEQRGLLLRTHGGAVRNDALVRVDSSIAQRMDAQADAKRRIGARAAALVRDGETLILNGGSTTCYFAAALGERRDLTVITNNLRLPPAVPEAAARAIHILGGAYWAVSQVTLGPVGFPQVVGINADTAVLGVTGISDRGPSMGVIEEAAAAAAMIDVAARTILVADSSKLGVTAFAAVAGFSRIDVIVTDAEPPPAITAALAAAGTQLLIC